MSGSNFFRLIEDYFNGGINATDKALLENQLLQDPLLQAEFNLQKNIHEGLSNVRKQELKQRLSSIEMTPVTVNVMQSAAVKWLAATVTAATLLGGLLYYMMGDNNPIIPLDINQFQAMELSIAHDLPHLPSVDTTKEEQIKAASLEATLAESSFAKQPEKVSTSKTQAVAKVSDQETTDIAIQPQSLLSFEDENLFNRQDARDLEKIKPVSIKTSPTMEANIKVLKAQEPNKYHYQYFNSKLFLYGDFKEEPYEIIELKRKGDKSLYLSYKDTVYVINANITEITALQALNDEKLLNELKIISTSK